MVGRHVHGDTAGTISESPLQLRCQGWIGTKDTRLGTRQIIETCPNIFSEKLFRVGDK